MMDDELRVKKLSFERMYNYGTKSGENIEGFLKNNPKLSKVLINCYKEILNEPKGFPEEYYASVRNKLMYLEDLKNGG